MFRKLYIGCVIISNTRESITIRPLSGKEEKTIMCRLPSRTNYVGNYLIFRKKKTLNDIIVDKYRGILTDFASFQRPMDINFKSLDKEKNEVGLEFNGTKVPIKLSKEYHDMLMIFMHASTRESKLRINEMWCRVSYGKSEGIWIPVDKLETLCCMSDFPTEKWSNNSIILGLEARLQKRSVAINDFLHDIVDHLALTLACVACRNPLTLTTKDDLQFVSLSSIMDYVKQKYTPDVDKAYQGFQQQIVAKKANQQIEKEAKQKVAEAEKTASETFEMMSNYDPIGTSLRVAASNALRSAAAAQEAAAKAAKAAEFATNNDRVKTAARAAAAAAATAAKATTAANAANELVGSLTLLINNASAPERWDDE